MALYNDSMERAQLLLRMIGEEVRNQNNCIGKIWNAMVRDFKYWENKMQLNYTSFRAVGRNSYRLLLNIRSKLDEDSFFLHDNNNNNQPIYTCANIPIIRVVIWYKQYS